MRRIKTFRLYESSDSFDDAIRLAFGPFTKDDDGYHFEEDVFVRKANIEDAMDKGILPSDSLKKLPIKIASVQRGLKIYNLGLETLEGCPEKVPYHFDCSGNQLRDLKNGPSFVGETYSCHKSSLVSLEGSPYQVSSLYVESNLLRNLSGGPRRVLRNLYLDRNPLTSLLGLPEFIGGTLSLTSCDSLESLNGLHMNIGKVMTSWFSIDWNLASIFNYLMSEASHNQQSKQYLLTFFEDRDLSVEEEKMLSDNWEFISSIYDNPNLAIDRIKFSPDMLRIVKTKQRFI
jgi:hypothetical protein